MTTSAQPDMRRPYLLIAGTTKAATTSVFEYLKDHPEVCVSNLKETRFFLDLDYPLASKYRYDSAPDRYGDFFSPPNHPVKLWVDATPDYLYSPGTPVRVRAALADVRLVFLLREPLSRVISWYRFARQNNDLDPALTLDAYASQQLDHLGGSQPNQAQHLRAVEEGQYARYLKPYFDIFGPDRIFVAFLEEISRDPRLVMTHLARFAGIDPSYYDSYQFQVFNQTKDLKNARLYGLYRKVRFNINQRINRFTGLRSMLRRLRRAVLPDLEQPVQAAEPQENTFSGAVQKRLQDYYDPANRDLVALLNRDLPW